DPLGRFLERFGLLAQLVELLEVGVANGVLLCELLLAPLEEVIAGTAEALPDLVRHFPRRGPGRLPLLLQLLDRIAGLVPLGRVLERLDLVAQLLFSREVGRALLVHLMEVR